MDYAIIKLGNKQHRVRHGETLVVDRLPTDEGKSFEPTVLLGDAKVTATVLARAAPRSWSGSTASARGTSGTTVSGPRPRASRFRSSSAGGAAAPPNAL